MKKLRIGVIGTGNMGQNHLRVLSTLPDFELAGAYDQDLKRCEKAASRHGIKSYGELSSLLSDVDAVSIAVPSSLHCAVAKAAAKAGCHMLVEKPIALTIQDGENIIEACEKAGVVLCVGHVERFNPAVRELKKIVQNEDLISLDFKRMSPFDKRIFDTDVVMDLMIHDIDVLNSIVSEPITRMVSQGAKVFSDRLDLAQAMLVFQNGVIASLTASRVTESKIRTLEINAKNAFISVDYLNRNIEIFRKTNFKLDIGHSMQYSQENIVERVFVPFSEPLRSEFENFAACIKDREKPVVDGQAGLKACKLILEIVEQAVWRGQSELLYA